MSYETTKSECDIPAEGHALVIRHTSRFRRSVNGAWLGAGSETVVREIPISLLNSPDGVGWLTPGRCGFVTVKFPCGGSIYVDGANDPIRASGFDKLGYVTLGGCRELMTLPGKLLPNIGKGYYNLYYLDDETLKTFSEL